MSIKNFVAAGLSLAMVSGVATAQEAAERPQITMGNGERNAIQIEGMTRHDDAMAVTSKRMDGADSSVMRTNSTSLTFDEVVIEKAGWIVLHPIIDGRPNGDIVSGFARLEAGRNEEVSIRMHHPADAGSQYIVMLHSDANEDGVFDFVFVEDGINVEDTAVFEGTRMIAHMITLPE
ncbi:DUF7282 domain-containing protein [Altererythrobacter lutimaris]|uniref:DUF7282 domain-containing protein n=1 Tax=Altererythrobacter lutimaris TaxID=2743979 RepID=A0A850HH12_9SPHN|nr:hypothetical protein [Altererythrobacter lutimaris]NVE94242.1 hypothetical protein [Altererythrobacter lutimaris]